MKKIEFFMNEAIQEAKKAYNKGEIPVGAILVKNNKIIARAHNLRESTSMSINHAEIIAITNANKSINNWRLNEFDLYVTLEPCAMCAGAIYNSRIHNLYYGAYDYKAGAVKSVFNVLDNEKLIHKVNHFGGVLEKESLALIKNFFKKRREEKKLTLI